MLFRSMQKLASVLELENKLPESETNYQHHLERLLRSLPKDHLAVLWAYESLAAVLLRENKYDKAEEAINNCLSGLEQNFPNNWRTFNARSLLAAC